MNEALKRWRKNHPEKARESVKTWRANNREKFNVHRRATKNDRDRQVANKRRKERWVIDPAFRFKWLLRNRLRKALTRGVKKTETAVNLLGCPLPEAMQHIESKFVKGMSWGNYGSWHIDHIRPCASFDLADPAQQKICFHYTNLQPLWAAENIAKSDKIMTLA